MNERMAFFNEFDVAKAQKQSNSGKTGYEEIELKVYVLLSIWRKKTIIQAKQDCSRKYDTKIA